MGNTNNQKLWESNNLEIYDRVFDREIDKIEEEWWYDNLVVCMLVLMQLWSSLVQQEESEDDAWLGLG